MSAIVFRVALATRRHRRRTAFNDVVAQVLTGRTHDGMMPERPNTKAIALHDDVARAIRLRDEVAAEKAMRAIIDEAAAVT
jgi:DNA-binding FadR family transcriptional regulator